MPHVCGDEPDTGLGDPELNRMPHVCGDEPYTERLQIGLTLYAPRMWG